MDDTKYQYRFPNGDIKIIRSYSQALQDLFVVLMLRGKNNGTFLELGAGNPSYKNNTYLLEKEFGFSGISIDCEPVNSYNHPKETISWLEHRKKAKYIQEFAESFDYESIGNYFDYLQIDINANYTDSIRKVLRKLISKEFAVITFEHDYWNKSDESKNLMLDSRNHFISLGYELFIDNVTCQKPNCFGEGDIFFEDWYVNKKFVDYENIKKYKWLDNRNIIKYPSDILLGKLNENNLIELKLFGEKKFI